MPIGVSLQLFDGTNPQANLTNIQAYWWDVEQPEDIVSGVMAGRSDAVTTDASGYVTLDLSNVSGLSVGDYGFLTLYKLDATDSQDSLVFSGRVQTSTVSSGTVLFGVSPSWVRNSEWLSLPSVGPTEEKFAGLFAVYDHSTNIIALAASGNYTVDWGDGVVENVSSGVTAQHTYSFSDPDLDGTLTSDGYKQAVVTVVPQAGQTLTAFSLQVAHTNSGTYYRGGNWLDIRIGGPSITNLRLGTSSSSALAGYWKHLFENVEIISHSVTDMYGLFYNCTCLRRLVIADTSAVTNMSNMFTGCTALSAIPYMDTGSVSNLSSTFSNCYSLDFIVLRDISSATTVEGMFALCRTLKSAVILGSTPSLLTMRTMFSNCMSLVALKLPPSVAATTMNNMFNGCYSLVVAPELYTSEVTDFGSMFQSCGSLLEAPTLDTAKATTMASMFNGCTSMRSVPLYNTQNVTLMSYTFSNCSSLVEVPAFDTSKVTNMSNMCASCTSLQVFNPPIGSLVTTVSSILSYCQSLRRITSTGFKLTFTVADANLGPDALDELYTNLASVSAKTITVTGNYGTASDTPSIATAKGWTVTG